MAQEKIVFESGNELAARAAKQINYHLMGYYPITPSTQIAEKLDALKAEGKHDIAMIPAEGEHGAFGICFGGTAAGGRVFNATSANGLLYALEQMPVQSGTRLPMVLNISCRTISGPLSIKGDHSDIMYTLNTGWIILFAKTPQEVYDLNICALKIAEAVKLPVIVAYDGFFTSHQKNKVKVFAEDETVQNFIGKYKPVYNIFDTENPVTIGSYMNEPDLINNKYQLHLAMEEAKNVIKQTFSDYQKLSERTHEIVEGYCHEDAEVLLFVLGSAYSTAHEAVLKLRSEGKKAGVITLNVLRPWYSEELYNICKNAKVIICADRQDSYGAGGGNMSIELKASLQEHKSDITVISRIYGLSGKDFYVEDAEYMLNLGFEKLNQNSVKTFDYYGQYKGKENYSPVQYFDPIKKEETKLNIPEPKYDEENKKLEVKTPNIRDFLSMPNRLSPGHGACPGCGIPVNVNMLLKGIEGNVILLFHTGCGMIVSTPYPKTAFKVSYIHNLFQNGASTLSGVLETFYQRQKRGELPQEEFTFVMITGDGGLDIGLGNALGTALRNNHMIIMEYDNGGYMNTGYQQSYATPLGAKSSTSNVGKAEKGKKTFHKDSAELFAATNIPYVATVAECMPTDFIKKAIKAQFYAKNYGLAFIKSLSACPLNWSCEPRHQREIIQLAVDSCYHPLYEVENGITTINYNPENKNKKIPVSKWLESMGRTKHITRPEYQEIADEIQKEVDRRWERLKAKNDNPLL